MSERKYAAGIVETSVSRVSMLTPNAPRSRLEIALPNTPEKSRFAAYIL